MQGGFLPDVVTVCVGCGRERELPEGRATRVLEGEALYADVLDACECGARRVRVDVTFDSAPASEPPSGKPPDRGPFLL